MFNQSRMKVAKAPWVFFKLQWIETFWRDLSYGWQALKGRPVFAFTAILSLSLGIGANSAIFSILDGMFLHPPAVDKPSELVRVFSTSPDGSDIPVSLQDYWDMARQSKSLAGLAGEKFMIVTLRHQNQSQFINSLIVSENYFDVLKPPLTQGRSFLPVDYRPAGPWPAVISYGIWKKQFDGDAQIIGQSVLIENHSFTILGVLSSEFRAMDGLGAIDIYLPIQAWKSIDLKNTDYQLREARILNLYGRPQAGYSVPQVQGELALIANQLAQTYPNTNRGYGIRVIPDRLYRLKAAGSFGLLLAIVIVLILLMSCVNVANLLLAQADRRRREFTIRVALGAARNRLIRQMLTESFLLSFLGSLAGLLIAFVLINLVPLSLPSYEGFAPTFQIDRRVIIFSMLLVVLTSVLFGLFPAWRISKPELLPELKGAMANQLSGRPKLRMRSALIVAQLAVTMVLLAGTCLMLMSLRKLVTADLGFPKKNLLTIFVHVGDRPESSINALLQQWVEKVKLLPGIKEASMARRVPIVPQLGGTWETISILSSPLPPEKRKLSTSYNSIGLNFFKTMGIPILRGRDFNLSDTASSSRVMIVNETMAHRFWPDRDALGQNVLIGGSKGRLTTVVGVAKNTKVEDIDEPDFSYFYVPCTQDYRPFTTLVAEINGEPMQLVKPIRAELSSLDPELPTGMIITLKHALRLRSGSQASFSTLLGVLGLIGLVLAMVGLYGIVAYVANQRSKEIGIRMALGARPANVAWLILGQGFVLILFGIGLGLLAIRAASNLISGFLFGVAPMDATALLGGTLLLSLIAVLACYVPAHRATKIDPMITLRAE